MVPKPISLGFGIVYNKAISDEVISLNILDLYLQQFIKRITKKYQ